MNTSLIPVRSALDKKGQLVSLVPFLRPGGPTDATPFPAKGLLETDLADRKTQVNFFYTSMRVAASLGVVSAASASTSAMYDVAIFDVMDGVEKIRTGELDKQYLVQSTFWGSSVRVVMRVRALDAKVKGGFGLLAAGAELGLAQVDYEVRVTGRPYSSTMAIALEGIPLLGSLNFDAYSKLMDACEGLIQKVTSSISNTDLRPIAVTISTPLAPDALGEAQSKRYAMTSIANLRSLDHAKSHMPSHLNLDTIKDVYADVLGESIDVTSAHGDSARRWLNA